MDRVNEFDRLRMQFPELIKKSKIDDEMTRISVENATLNHELIKLRTENMDIYNSKAMLTADLQNCRATNSDLQTRLQMQQDLHTMWPTYHNLQCNTSTRNCIC